MRFRAAAFEAARASAQSGSARRIGLMHLYCPFSPASHDLAGHSDEPNARKLAGHKGTVRAVTHGCYSWWTGVNLRLLYPLLPTMRALEPGIGMAIEHAKMEKSDRAGLFTAECGNCFASEPSVSQRHFGPIATSRVCHPSQAPRPSTQPGRAAAKGIRRYVG